MDCTNAAWDGDCSRSVWTEPGLYLMAIAMFGGSLSDSLVYTFGNSIILDTIG